MDWKVELLAVSLEQSSNEKAFAFLDGHYGGENIVETQKIVLVTEMASEDDRLGCKSGVTEL